MITDKEAKNRIRILCTSDVHGKIFPHNYVNGGRENYGFGRLAAAIKKLRDENTILIDNGDVLSGSPLLQYHMMNKGKDNPASRVMRAMNYDFVNVGNHDFDFGLDILLDHIKGTGARCITENAVHKKEELPLSLLADSDLDLDLDLDSAISENDSESRKPKSLPAERRSSYHVVEIAGKRIAVFGLVTQFVSIYETEEEIRDLTFFDALERAKEIVSEIKEDGDIDYIILVYHGGFEFDPETGEAIGVDNGENQGYKMLREIPEIDVILAGHQHRLFEGVFVRKEIGLSKGEPENNSNNNSNNSRSCTAYTQPEEGGIYLSCVDIDIESGAIKPSLVRIENDADSEVLAIVEEDEKECQTWLDKAIGESKLDLGVHDELDARLNKTQLVTYLNNLQREHSGADLSGVAIGFGATGLGTEVTMRQVVGTYLFPDMLVKKRITGKVLREYLEKNMEFWTICDGRIEVNPAYLEPFPQHFNYDMIDGVEYAAKISNPVGSRITSLKRNGIDITDDMEFTIVVSSFRAAGGGNYFMISESETLWQSNLTMVDIILKDITERKVIDFEPVNNIEITI